MFRKDELKAIHQRLDRLELVEKLRYQRESCAKGDHEWHMGYKNHALSGGYTDFCLDLSSPQIQCKNCGKVKEQEAKPNVRSK